MATDAEQLRLLPEEKDLTPDILRAEVNLLIFPFFSLAKKGLYNKTETEYKAIVQRGSQKVEMLWQVTANAKYGYPGPFDKQVHKAIEELLTELRLPISNPIPFSIYGLCKRMGINTSGRNYSKVKKALERIKLTGIKSVQAYYSKASKRWIDDVFNLYERIIFRGEAFPDGRVAEANYLYLSSWYLENINALYLKPIDYKYYRSLSIVAQRLYELLGVKFYHILKAGHPCLRYRYSTLCNLLPVEPQRYPSLVRRQLDPAHQELLSTSFLSKSEWGEGGKGDWIIEYYPGERAKAEIERYRDALPREMETVSQDEIEIKGLVQDILQVTGDEHSRPFYTQLAKMVLGKPKLYDLIYQCLSEVRYESHQGFIRTTKGAVFTDRLKRYCQELGIELGLKTE